MQEKDINDILTSVLDIIEYDEDKDMFISSFTKLYLEDALLETIKLLPESKQKLVAEAIANKSSENGFAEIKKNIDPDVYKKVFGESLQKTLQGFLNKIMPELSENKQQELQTYLLSLQTK